MKSNTRKIIFTCIILTGIVSAFVGGFYIGIDFAYKLYKPTFESELYTRSLANQLILEKIDKNEMSEGHNFLMTKLMGDILALDIQIEASDETTMKDKMKKLLERIAAHREQFPALYSVSGKESPELEQANQEINAILERYASKS